MAPARLFLGVCLLLASEFTVASSARFGERFAKRHVRKFQIAGGGGGGGGGEARTDITLPGDPPVTTTGKPVPNASTQSTQPATDDRGLPIFPVSTGDVGGSVKLNDVQQHNLTITLSPCFQPIVTGEFQCSFPRPNAGLRWGYSLKLLRCIPFYYNGCGGNDNNFKTEEECKEECFGTVQPQPIPTDTLLPPFTIGTGPITAPLPTETLAP